MTTKSAHDSIIKGKDLTIQKLQLQLAVRDKVIARQRAVLEDNGLDEMVGYSGLLLMEQKALAQNFDTLRMPAPGGTGPSSPVRSPSSMHGGLHPATAVDPSPVQPAGAPPQMGAPHRRADRPHAHGGGPNVDNATKSSNHALFGTYNSTCAIEAGVRGTT